METSRKLRMLARNLIRLAEEIDDPKRKIAPGKSPEREAIISEYFSTQPECIDLTTAVRDLKALGAFSQTSYAGDIKIGLRRRIEAAGRTCI